MQDLTGVTGMVMSEQYYLHQEKFAWDSYSCDQLENTNSEITPLDLTVKSPDNLFDSDSETKKRKLDEDTSPTYKRLKVEDFVSRPAPLNFLPQLNITTNTVDFQQPEPELLSPIQFPMMPSPILSLYNLGSHSPPSNLLPASSISSLLTPPLTPKDLNFPFYHPASSNSNFTSSGIAPYQYSYSNTEQYQQTVQNSDKESYIPITASHPLPSTTISTSSYLESQIPTTASSQSVPNSSISPSPYLQSYPSYHPVSNYSPPSSDFISNITQPIPGMYLNQEVDEATRIKNLISQAQLVHQAPPQDYHRVNTMNDSQLIHQIQPVSQTLSFIYEKSLGSVKRWRENGVTIQVFYCAVCQLPSDSEERLKSHIETVHSDGQLEPRVRCGDCGQECRDGPSLTRHQLLHGDGESDSKEKCTSCGRTFPSQSSMTEHFTDCSIYRPYRCDYCGKGYVIGARLKAHMSQCSSGPRPPSFTCKVCNKQYDNSMDYNRHLPVHAFM